MNFIKQFNILRFCSVLFVLSSISLPLFSQPVTETTAINNFNIGKYELALKNYLQLYKNEPENQNFCYQVGRCYLKINIDRSRAIPYFDKLSKKPAYSENPKFYFDYAMANFYAHRFELAITYFNKCKLLTKEDELKHDADHQIEMCLNAQALIKSPVDVKFVNLGKKVNTRFADINPFVTEDETQLVFSSNSESNFNIYMAKKRKNSENWGKPKALSSQVNTIDDEIVGGFTSDGNYIFIHYNSYSSAEDITFSKFDITKYKEVENLGQTVNTTFKEEGACMNSTKDTLYFASNKPGGFGGFDIYYSIKLPNGQWGKPMNMGQIINTPYDENYPNISNDGKTFYFSSKGHNSMGGYDIFYCMFDTIRKQWNQPVNIGYPINDTYDNTEISMLSNKRYGYISAIRNSGLGDYDIYKVIFNKIEAENIIFKGTISVADTVVGGSAKLLKDIDPNITIKVNKRETGEVYGIYAFNKNSGAYVISLIPGNYELIVEGPSYIQYKKIIEVGEELFRDKVQNLNIFLQIKPEKTSQVPK